MTLSQGSICTKRVHLGLSEVAFIEGCPNVNVKGLFLLKEVHLGLLYRGVSSRSGVGFMRGSTVLLICAP